MECVIEEIAVHYDAYGEGRPLLVLPGWAAGAQFSVHFKETLFGGLDGWRRIYLDPPGHGRSAGAPRITNMDGILEVVVSFVDMLLPGESFALAGYSAGAYLARGIAYLRPEQVDGLFLCAPLIVASDEGREAPEHIVLVDEPGLDLGADPHLDALVEVAAIRTQAALEPFASPPDIPKKVDGDPGFRRQIRNNPDRYSFSFDVDELEKPFSRPALIVTGRQDSVVGYRDAWKVLENFPRATFVVFDRSGHLLEEKQELNRALVREWLERVEELSG